MSLLAIPSVIVTLFFNNSTNKVALWLKSSFTGSAWYYVIYFLLLAYIATALDLRKEKPVRILLWASGIVTAVFAVSTLVNQKVALGFSQQKRSDLRLIQCLTFPMVPQCPTAQSPSFSPGPSDPSAQALLTSCLGLGSSEQSKRNS